MFHYWLRWAFLVFGLFLAGCPSSENTPSFGGERARRGEPVPAAFDQFEREVEAGIGDRTSDPLPSFKERLATLPAALREPELKRASSVLESLSRSTSTSDIAESLLILEYSDFDLPDAQRQLAREILVEEQQSILAELESEPELDLVAQQQLFSELLLISIALGKEEQTESYEIAVAGLYGVLNETGRFGSQTGGFLESSSASQRLMGSALWAASFGDSRLRAHPYFAFAPYWFMHHLQPGDFSYPSHGVGRVSEAEMRRLIAKELLGLSMLQVSEDIRWWLENFAPNDADLLRPELYVELAGLDLPEDFEPPAPYGIYPDAALVFWRSSWDFEADGLVAIGALIDEEGTAKEAGHISWLQDGKPVLVEVADTNEVIDSEGNTVVIPAHNVVRVGDGVPRERKAPIITRELTTEGGNLRIDCSGIFAELGQWHRDLFWTTGGELRIIDNIAYSLGVRDRTEMFWHLGATEPVEITEDESRTIIEWGSAAVVIQSNVPMELRQFMVPSGVEVDGEQQMEVVIAMRTIGRPPSFRVLTRVLHRELGAEAEILDDVSQVQ
ncbi:MAG: hypothetical protein AAFX93_15745 [Verrucomicrobiota bacterium]